MKNLVRRNILNLTPYSSARDEFEGEASTFLDANENPYPGSYNRYPDPLQKQLKQKLGEIKGVKPAQLFLGNGSDEAIDLLIRAYCEPGQDSILITEPTYGMYAVCAGVNGVSVQRVPLTPNFELDEAKILENITPTTKIIFLCSPNNPSGNLLNKKKIETVIQSFNGLVVIDEAYIDFSTDSGFVSQLSTYPNLVILQTLSKAWGLAGLRLGICFASEEIISVLNKIKYPYNINSVTQQLALEVLSNETQKNNHVEEILRERETLRQSLSALESVVKIYPSDANFLLVKVRDAKKIYTQLLQQGIVVRDRSSVAGCENCLRITVGTQTENKLLINTLKEI
jgi:histidinol-phosphate aminotransferase